MIVSINLHFVKFLLNEHGMVWYYYYIIIKHASTACTCICSMQIYGTILEADIQLVT